MRVLPINYQFHISVADILKMIYNNDRLAAKSNNNIVCTYTSTWYNQS